MFRMDISFPALWPNMSPWQTSWRSSFATVHFWHSDTQHTNSWFSQTPSTLWWLLWTRSLCGWDWSKQLYHPGDKSCWMSLWAAEMSRRNGKSHLVKLFDDICVKLSLLFEAEMCNFYLFRGFTWSLWFKFITYGSGGTERILTNYRPGIEINYNKWPNQVRHKHVKFKHFLLKRALKSPT